MVWQGKAGQVWGTGQGNRYNSVSMASRRFLRACATPIRNSMAMAWMDTLLYCEHVFAVSDTHFFGKWCCSTSVEELINSSQI